MPAAERGSIFIVLIYFDMEVGTGGGLEGTKTVK